MENLKPQIGKRKFILCFFVLFWACVFLGLGKLTGGEFTTIVSVAFASFSLANSAEYLGAKVAK